MVNLDWRDNFIELDLKDSFNEEQYNGDFTYTGTEEQDRTQNDEERRKRLIMAI